MNYANTDTGFWRSVVGGAFGLALAAVWLRFGFLAFLLALVFTVLGSLIARSFMSDWS